MSELLVNIDDTGVATVTLNRPEKLNALNGVILEALPARLSELADDDGVRVVVLAGAGRAFCAGGDVGAMATGSEFEGPTFEAQVAQLRRAMEASRLLHTMAKPTICRLQGAAAGAGLSLALACDLRVADTTARIGTAFARVGYSGDFGGSYFLTRLVGPARARELYFFGHMLDVEAAATLGLVNWVVASDQLDAHVEELAGRLARGPRIAYGYMKRNLNAALDSGLADVLDLEALHHMRCGQTEDHREAAEAFIEKRHPVFRGR